MFSVTAEDWFTIKKLTLATSSQCIETDNLKHLKPHFDKRLVSEIQAKDVSRYQQDRLAEGASPKTANLEVGTLRAILRRHRVWAEIQQEDVLGIVRIPVDSLKKSAKSAEAQAVQGQ